MLEPPTLALHAVGLTGFTAYFGLFDIGMPRPGDTVVVSAAAGAVGQIAGQLAKLAGCRTVGIAGGPEKTRDLTELYRYDKAIDYKSEDVGEALRNERVDVYFDNVGGEISQAVHRRLNVGARIVICGQVSQYNAQRPEPTFHPGLLVVFRARMEGFLVFDYAHRYDEAAIRLAAVGRERRHPLARGRHRRSGERSSGIHRDAQRREPGQSPRQGRRAYGVTRTAGVRPLPFETCPVTWLRSGAPAYSGALARWVPSASFRSAAQKTVRFVRCTTRPSARSVPGRVGRKNSACRSAVRNVSPRQAPSGTHRPSHVSRIVVTSPPWTIGPDEPGKQ